MALEQPENIPPRRKKKVAEEEPPHHVHDESNWLVSYADMMTLLFCFFVLMYSMSKVDKNKFEVVRKEVAKFFGGKVTSDPAVKKVEEAVRKTIDEAGLKEVKVVAQEGRLQLRFQGAVLFESGAAVLRPEMKPLIDKIVNLIKQQSRVEEIRVEGHTDDDAIHSAVFPSNWELSGARASTIVRAFIEGGFKSDLLVAEGYAESRPLVPNQDSQGVDIPANKEQNRRVQLDITFGSDPMAARNAIVSKQFAPTPEAAQGPGGANVDPVAESTPEAEAKTPQQVYQEKLKAAQDRLKEAAQKAKEAQALEALNKKIQDLEQKATATEKSLGIAQPAASAKPRPPVMNMNEGLKALEKNVQKKKPVKTAQKNAKGAAKQQRKPAATKPAAPKLPTKKK